MKKLILIIFFSTIFLSSSQATTLEQALGMAYKNNPKLNNYPSSYFSFPNNNDWLNFRNNGGRFV